MTRHRVLAQVAALALSAPCSLLSQSATTFSPQSVPFVGCPSDGQAGPAEAPKGTTVMVTTSREAAEQLAYYKSWPDYGALAPRGWHCFGVYGSSGDSLFITREPIDASRAFSIHGGELAGPAVVIEHTFGGTSGRDQVARIIARVFPKYGAFVKSVREMFDLPADTFPSGPHPADKLAYPRPRVVEFRTPSQTDGLGTDSWMAKGGTPIDGVAILVGDTPDLLLLSVRLPPGLAGLTTTIVRQTELDAKLRPHD